MKCRRCGEDRPAEFYASRKTSCKACIRLRMKNYRTDNHAEVCQRDRDRSKLSARKAKAVEYQRARRIREPIKSKARNAVNNAVRDGRLRREPCIYCGKKRVQGHHSDYSQPLNVTWVCFKCHREREHGGRVDEVGWSREGPVLKGDR